MILKVLKFGLVVVLARVNRPKGVECTGSVAIDVECIRCTVDKLQVESRYNEKLLLFVYHFYSRLNISFDSVLSRGRLAHLTFDTARSTVHLTNNASVSPGRICVFSAAFFGSPVFD